jgi:uncharacterized protein (DUF427 family)
MATKPRLFPSAKHPITVSPTKGRVVVTAGGKVIADSRNSLTLQESTYPAVQYVPLADVDPSVLVRTDTETYCAYKGDASYYSISVDGKTVADAVWEYREPRDAVTEIKDHVAFYPDRVDSIDIRED